jgi:hypothetical protein
MPISLVSSLWPQSTLAVTGTTQTSALNGHRPATFGVRCILIPVTRHPATEEPCTKRSGRVTPGGLGTALHWIADIHDGALAMTSRSGLWKCGADHCVHRGCRRRREDPDTTCTITDVNLKQIRAHSADTLRLAARSCVRCRSRRGHGRSRTPASGRSGSGRGNPRRRWHYSWSGLDADQFRHWTTSRRALRGLHRMRPRLDLIRRLEDRGEADLRQMRLADKRGESSASAPDNRLDRCPVSPQILCLVQRRSKLCCGDSPRSSPFCWF